MTYDITKPQATTLASSPLSWLFNVVVIFALAACGGGGGGGDNPAAAPSPATLVVLNAQEELAYQSWALRLVTIDFVTDDDALIAVTPFRSYGRLDFAGKYPVGGATGTDSNFPTVNGNSISCKDGGSAKQTDTLKNNNNTFDAGESSLLTYENCKDGIFVLAGTSLYNHLAPLTFYRAPNDKAIESTLLDLVTDLNNSNTTANIISLVKGIQKVDINQDRRIYTLINMAYPYAQGSVVGNTLIGINRSDDFGPDKPFTVAGFAGSATIDGKPYTVSSSKDIPWIKRAGYFPKSGSITATAANGDKIITEFTATGARCSLVPAGATAASVAVEQCSKI
jgi:hypothetical protein